MKKQPVLQFLYHTVPGRGILKLLIRPGVSRLAGRFLDSGLSRPFVAPFIRKNHISLKGIRVPEHGFRSFNDFFTRKSTAVSFDPTPEHLCSPCDGYLSCFPIDGDGRFHIKHTDYSLYGLLQWKELAEEFRGGLAMIFRLTPANYHRYYYVDDGLVLARKRIPGVLHCVRPVATESFPVYLQNSREYTLLQSGTFGRMIQMEVGALLVGRIHNHGSRGKVVRGAEKGYFEFGGSTILLLLPEKAVRLKQELTNALKGQEEAPVRAGEWIGERIPAEKLAERPFVKR